MAVLPNKTAINSHKISLFFSAPNHQPPRISAEDETSVADKSLPQTAKTGSPAARARSTSRRRRESGGQGQAAERSPLISAYAGTTILFSRIGQ
jgi:hypothetical protein